MAISTSTTDSSRWTSANFNHSVAAAAWDAVKHEANCLARTQIANAALAARDALYSAPAPDLDGVIQKISIWFGEHLFHDSFEMACHRGVIGDLRRIALQAAGADESDASGRTVKQAEKDAAKWREALANYKRDEQPYREGPSPGWEARDGADIVAVMAYRMCKLLELPAPNLGGMIQKLDMLWGKYWLETDGGGAFLVELKRDIYRLAPEIEAAIWQRH